MREGKDMDTVKLLNTGDTCREAIYGWGAREGEIPLGHKIRVTFQGLAPQSGYAYKQEGAWLGIRYTWRSAKWWSLLNYNNPLVKLELSVMDSEGKSEYKVIWERAND
jgi:hypothetical protein